jgi:hypothetical protein
MRVFDFDLFLSRLVLQQRADCGVQKLYSVVETSPFL